MIAAQQHHDENTPLPSLDEAKNYIHSIDFSPIINKMVNHQGWSRKHAEALSHEYRKFLFLSKKYRHQYGQLPPSEEIDEFWHNHILDTKKYRHDCQQIFGFYLDHYPYFGIDETSNYTDLLNAFRHTETTYQNEFGIEMPKITHRFSKIFMVIRKMLRRNQQ